MGEPGGEKKRGNGGEGMWIGFSWLNIGSSNCLL